MEDIKLENKWRFFHYLNFIQENIQEIILFLSTSYKKCEKWEKIGSKTVKTQLYPTSGFNRHPV